MSIKEDLTVLRRVMGTHGSTKEAWEALKRLEEVEEAEHARLLKNLQHARDYSYEATMGDYSMASINSAKAQVDKAIMDLTNAGYELPTW